MSNNRAVKWQKEYENECLSMSAHYTLHIAHCTILYSNTKHQILKCMKLCKLELNDKNVKMIKKKKKWQN